MEPTAAIPAAHWVAPIFLRFCISKSCNIIRRLRWMEKMKTFFSYPTDTYHPYGIPHLQGQAILMSKNWAVFVKLTPACRAIRQLPNTFPVFAWPVVRLEIG